MYNFVNRPICLFCCAIIVHYTNIASNKQSHLNTLPREKDDFIFLNSLDLFILLSQSDSNFISSQEWNSVTGSDDFSIHFSLDWKLKMNKEPKSMKKKSSEHVSMGDILSIQMMFRSCATDMIRRRHHHHHCHTIVPNHNGCDSGPMCHVFIFVSLEKLLIELKLIEL